jgi:RES domain-containing protein
VTLPPTLRITRRFWRMLAPRWAHEPLGGAGAARHGGRYNPPGLAALYMSEEFTTAVAEYEQELGIRPGILCAYDVDATGIVDLADGDVRTELGVAEADLFAPWKRIALIDKQQPVTWTVARRLFDAGAAGVRAPSVQAAGINLVLWRWNDALDRRVVALDPLSDLPRDDRSWT